MNSPTEPQAGLELPSDTALRLLRRYRTMLWLLGGPLLLLVVILGAWHGWTAYRNALAAFERDAQLQQAQLQVLTRELVQHVAELRRQAELKLLLQAERPDPLLAQALRSQPDGSSSLDGLPQLVRPGLAQLIASAEARPDDAMLWRLQRLSELTESAHAANPQLRASFVLDWPARALMHYPWLPSTSLQPDGQLAGWYQGQLFQGARPADNAAQRPYWVWPSKADGAEDRGPILAAPLYVGERFRGLVGAELRGGALRSALELGSHWWLLAPTGTLAQAEGSAPPLSSAQAQQQAERHPGQALRQGPWQLIVQPLGDTPWLLIQARSEQELFASIATELLPFEAIAGALLLVLLLTQWLLRERVIDPALAVMHYLHDKARDDRSPEPQLNDRWQPWVRVISATFAAQRLARERERRSEAHKAAIVDQALAAIITADASGQVQEWNAAAQRMFGWTRDQALGQDMAQLLLPAEQRPLLHEAMAAAQRPEGASAALELRARRADGADLPVELALSATHWADELHFTAILIDQTDRQRAAQELEAQRDAMRQSEKLSAMGLLLANIAHELNNPMAIVLGRAALLEAKASGSPLAAEASTIREAADRCGRIVKTFLSMAKGRPLQRQPVRLAELVRAATDLLAHSLRAERVELDIAVDADLPELQADPDRIGQLLLNLLVNALQALAQQPGPRRLSISASCELGQLWLRIEDNGPGIAEAQREQLFQPFFTTKGEGTGLGLALSRSVAREHGGELRLLPPSEAWPGARFELRLPLP